MYTILVRAMLTAMHHWPGAPDSRAYLRDSHRHNFLVTVGVGVNESDRELEMHDLQEKLMGILESIPQMDDSGQLDFGSMSCEQIGDEILKRMPEAINAQVNEDELHGAVAFPMPNIQGDSMKVVTVCGSTKFKKETEQAIAMLEERGDAVFSVGSFMHADNAALTKEQKNRYDRLHLQKITVSDYIYVVNPEGYIGESTTVEIKFAKSRGKHIEYFFKRNSAITRGSIQEFAKDMEHKLKANDHKGGWENFALHELFDLLQDEVNELSEAMQDEGASSNYAESVIDECADVANYAMMIADTLRIRKESS